MDILNGGTPTSDDATAGHEAQYACDNDTGTYFTSAAGVGLGSALPHWWKYDLGVGITKIVTKLRIMSRDVSAGGDFGCKDFTLQGSNDDSNWTTILTAQQAANANWQEYLFANVTAYRYYKVNVTTVWQPSSPTLYTYMSIWEFEMMEQTGQILSLNSKKW